jgi:chromosome segregation protein
MRIKQLELNGFKSFMSRTVLELPLGVTAVVGPNGCGKSNIVDAIRWVLGEQSPKHLRGGSMEDVVFAGNGDNGPLGMAEVSLLLERDEGDLLRAAAEAGEETALGVEGLPPELTRASEVLVTRRYFRSGESEYFINRTPCRLKDITELFLGTGVGTKAYAIIEQGRVEQLVNAKPPDLRLFIEEAAGTTRFRARKTAAERKMERTRDNLARVQDVVGELERQIGSLRRQARRAEEYHRIKDELRTLDLRVMAARQRACDAEALALRERLEGLRAEETALQEELERVQLSTDAARRVRQEREARLRAVDEEITELRVAASEAQGRADALRRRSAEMATRAGEARHEAGLVAERLRQTSEQAAGLEAELAELTAAHDQADAEDRRAQERLEASTRGGEAVEQALESAKDAVVGAVSEEAHLRNMAEALRLRSDEVQGRRRRLDEEQQALGERLEQNARERDANKVRLAELTDQGSALDAQRRASAADLSEAAATLEAGRQAHEGRRDEARQLASRADSLRELQARYEGCTRGVASLLERAGSGGVLLAGVLRVPAHLERAVAAALGARLGQVVLPDTQQALEAIGWLRDSGGGSATVLPHDPERRATVIVPPGRRLVDEIEVDTEHWGLAEALLGSVLLADDVERAVQVWRAAEHAVTVVTPQGDAIDALGAVSGGSEPPLEETLLARARYLRELEREIAEAEERVRQSALELEALGARVEQVSQRIAQEDEQGQALRLDVLANDKDRERLEEEHARIMAELEVGALEASGLAGATGQIEGELAALQAGLAEATVVVGRRREALGDRQEALACWRQEHAAAEQAHTAAAVHAAALTERLRSVEIAVARSREAIAELEGRLRAIGGQEEDATAAAALAASEAEAADVAHGVADAKVGELGIERERLLAELQATDEVLSADDQAQRQSRERLGEVRDQRGEIDVALTEIRMTLEQNAERLRERYDLGVEVLESVDLEAEPASEDDTLRAEELRSRLVRLGDVNPEAATELAEIQRRHEFLSTQRADLENSLADLRQTINKLTRTSRERFEQTFEDANAKLAEVFPKLFPGGKARLEFVPGEEGEEPGLEIIVQLSGKKLQSRSLLSGGEKALTATALVFSLFLIRPTPFCLLDEVDAPLDEANIGRFNAMVGEMAEHSQFVLITHNRRTMEVADTLYGITMEQAGVSKVVSVRLREAA